MWIVAEVGSSHKGSKELAYRYIQEYANAGATHIKFQLGWPPPPSVYVLDEWDEQNLHIIRHAPMEWVEYLVSACVSHNVSFFASIWSNAGLEAARGKMWGYKIAHQLNNNYDLITACMDGSQPLYVSGRTNLPDRGIWGIYVTDGYPSYQKKLPLVFHEKKGGHYGYSSHRYGYMDAVLAAARGALYIEKHVTLNVADLETRDHAFALPPAHFKDMARLCQAMRKENNARSR